EDDEGDKQRHCVFGPALRDPKALRPVHLADRDDYVDGKRGADERCEDADREHEPAEELSERGEQSEKTRLREAHARDRDAPPLETLAAPPAEQLLRAMTGDDHADRDADEREREVTVDRDHAAPPVVDSAKRVPRG